MTLSMKFLILYKKLKVKIIVQMKIYHRVLVSAAKKEKRDGRLLVHPLKSIGSVQNFHGLTAADRNRLTLLDMLGLVTGHAVDIGIIGSDHHYGSVLLRFGQPADVETGHLLAAYRLIDADGGERLVVADAVAHPDPKGFQLSGFDLVLRNKLDDCLVKLYLHLNRSLLEVALQQALESLAVAGLVAGHFMDGTPGRKRPSVGGVLFLRD